MGAKRWWRSWTGLAEERRGNQGYSVRRPTAIPPGHNRNDANPSFEFRELPRPDRRGQHQDSEQCQHRAYQPSSVHWVTSFLNRLDYDHHDKKMLNLLQGNCEAAVSQDRAGGVDVRSRVVKHDPCLSRAGSLLD